MTELSPCPIPAVSTKMRSKPSCFIAAITSLAAAPTSSREPRVASERMKTRPCLMLFIRMRSPSSAPPVLRLVGSTQSTATRFCGKSVTKRRTSSSVSELLPAPPVPVRPITGTFGGSPSGRSLPSSTSEILRASGSQPSSLAGAFSAMS